MERHCWFAADIVTQNISAELKKWPATDEVVMQLRGPTILAYIFGPFSTMHIHEYMKTYINFVKPVKFPVVQK